MKYLLVVLASVSLWASDNKIVYLLSTPRALSTVMFRMFENRDDFTGFLEPTIAVYDKEMYPLITEGWFRENAFSSYEEIKDKIFKAKESSHVVVKDVLFSSKSKFWLIESFTKNSDVHYVFLVRHPYKVVRSLYKGNGFVNDSFYEVAALKALYTMYCKIKLESLNNVHIVFADDLLKDSRSELEKIFSSINIPLSEKSLSWDYLDESFSGESWHAQLRLDLFHKWHNGALRSVCLKQSSNLEIPEEKSMFKHAATDEDSKLLFKIYKHHKPYYELFLKEKANKTL